jgi:hypothetical protein
LSCARRAGSWGRRSSYSDGAREMCTAEYADGVSTVARYND